MAVPGYWFLQNQGSFVKIMCVMGPLGYLLGALMYIVYARMILKEDDNKETGKGKKKKTDESSGTQDSHSEIFPTQGTQPKNFKQPILIKYYHFLPVCRYYLVLKDKEVDDIEGVFRVNSLS